MTKKQFKIKLAQLGLTQYQLAEKLQIHQYTISRYNSAEKYPLSFIYALDHLVTQENEQELVK